MRNFILGIVLIISALNVAEVEYDEYGNIQGLDIPSYNIIQAKDDILVMQSKLQAQIDLFLNLK